MAIPILSAINLNKNELQNARIQNLATAPSSPVSGQIYYDTSTSPGILYWYNGTAWQNAKGGVQSVTAGDSTITIGGTGADPTVRVAKTLDNTWITDFDARVRTSRLDQMAAPTASVSLNSQKITSLLDPTGAQDASTKNYVDSLSQGLKARFEARAATTTTLPSNVYANGASGVGATLTGSVNGAFAAVDGITLVANDRLLVKDEATLANNGIYVLTTVGDGSTKYVLTRATDSDEPADFNGAFIFAMQGTTNGGGGFVYNGALSPTLGTTSITYAQFSGAGEITTGNGLVKTGNTIAVQPGNGILADGTSTRVDPAVVVRKYATSVGDGAATSIVVTHNLNSQDVVVQCRDNTTPFAFFEVEVQATSVNTVTLVFAAAPTANQYRCIVHV